MGKAVVENAWRTINLNDFRESGVLARAVGCAGVLAVAGVLLAPVLPAGAVPLLGLGLFTRLEPADLLANADRRAILRAVRAEPGLHLRAIQRRVGLGWGSVSHHVTVLARAGVVRLERHSKFVHVFPANAVAPSPRALLTPHGAGADVFDALPERGEVTLAELQAALGLSRQLVSHHLRALRRAGLARVLPGRPQRHVRATAREPDRGG